jgi:hypothetical protein
MPFNIIHLQSRYRRSHHRIQIRPRMAKRAMSQSIRQPQIFGSPIGIPTIIKFSAKLEFQYFLTGK